MSLRKEILSETLRGNKIKTPEDVVDEIFSKIEKRIDSRIEDYKKISYLDNIIKIDELKWVKEILK